MLERVPYQPKTRPVSAAAEYYTPKFVYRDPQEGDGVDILEDFFGSRRKLRIAILGAGITTINLLHFLEQSIPADSVEVVVYEKECDVGGVWLTTRYPGCRNDMPGVTYQFLWRPNTQWSEFLPSAPEYCDYVQTVARENDFYRYMRFRHEIVKADWNDGDAKWTLKVHNLVNDSIYEEHFDLFLELNGPVNNPKIAVAGIENFKGQIVHTGEWPENLDIKNKTAALLGYGSSGVQLAPRIIDEVGKLYVWFRSKTYVLPPLLAEFAAKDGANFSYSEGQKTLLADRDTYVAYNKALDASLYRRFPGNINGSEGSIKGREAVLKFMEEKLSSKPGLFELLKPDAFDVGCRRPTLSHGYLETLASPKTTVLSQPPLRITETGIIDVEGNEHALDIIIAATGYDHSHLPRYPKTVNGQDMRARWKDLMSPPSYMGICLDGMPNYFNAGAAYAAAYGSWHHVAETMSKYIVQFIDKVQIERITKFTVKPQAVEHFTRHADTFMQRMVQSGPCSSWYKTKSGRPSLWPGNKSHFMKVLHTPRFEDFEMVYEDERNMFSYLGNGFALHPDGDMNDKDVTWWLEKPEREVSQEVLEKLRGVYADEVPIEKGTKDIVIG